MAGGMPFWKVTSLSSKLRVFRGKINGEMENAPEVRAEFTQSTPCTLKGINERLAFSGGGRRC